MSITGNTLVRVAVCSVLAGLVLIRSDAATANDCQLNMPEATRLSMSTRGNHATVEMRYNIVNDTLTMHFMGVSPEGVTTTDWTTVLVQNATPAASCEKTVKSANITVKLARASSDDAKTRMLRDVLLTCMRGGPVTPRILPPGTPEVHPRWGITLRSAGGKPFDSLTVDANGNVTAMVDIRSPKLTDIACN